MFGILREPDLRRGDVREERHRHPVVLPRQRFAEHAQEAHRALPAVAGDVLGPHRRRAVLQDDEIDAGRPDERRGGGRPRRARGSRTRSRESGRARTAGCRRSGNRSRTGSRRCWRNRRASRRRAASCQPQPTSSTPGRDAAATGTRARRTNGCEITSLATFNSPATQPQPATSRQLSPFRIFAPPLPASGASFRSSPRLGMTILNWFMSTAGGGPPGAAVQRRSGRQIAFVATAFSAARAAAFFDAASGSLSRPRLARANRELVVVGRVHGARLARLRTRAAADRRRLQHLRRSS